MHDPAEDALRTAMKDEIRTRRRAVRRAMPHDARLARSSEITRRITELPEWERARTVLLFVSMRSEVQTGELVSRARAEDKRVAAPRMNATFDDLELVEWREGDGLEESGMMFLQPPASAPPIDGAEIDLAVVPALAVDARGHRIGFGKGFYDRLLPRLSRALRVAVIFDFERVAEVPDQPGDQPVHLVVTDARTIRAGSE